MERDGADGRPGGAPWTNAHPIGGVGLVWALPLAQQALPEYKEGSWFFLRLTAALAVQ